MMNKGLEREDTKRYVMCMLNHPDIVHTRSDKINDILIAHRNAFGEEEFNNLCDELSRTYIEQLILCWIKSNLSKEEVLQGTNTDARIMLNCFEEVYGEEARNELQEKVSELTHMDLTTQRKVGMQWT